MHEQLTQGYSAAWGPLHEGSIQNLVVLSATANSTIIAAE